MTKRVVQHEVKLEKSVKIILAAMAFGVIAHAFSPSFGIKEALAETLGGTITLYHSGQISTN